LLKMRPSHKTLLFFFSVYLFFAVTMVAFDPHGAIPSKTCAICFMGISLFSAVGQPHVTGDVYCNTQYVRLAEEICRFICPASFSAVLYRGPPILPAFL
jgi:hypothetical protein